MRWFGESWGAPICEEEQIDTPVGEPCTLCEKEIEADDQGFEVPFWDGPFSTFVFYHKDCFLDSIGIRPE